MNIEINYMDGIKKETGLLYIYKNSHNIIRIYDFWYIPNV